ncbi:MAG: DUF2058 family protein [Candidatus Eisenbacteria bacterium]|nr:DUF2058 family protein [Candidatus Latescibacterota bacterium]MBD3303129.1 DUF2058 family protein [Candidatus Eisenbacteria bacterium]
MSDLRDQLRKAGLVSDKEIRRAKHEERVHASKVGAGGLAEEKRERERRLQEQREAERKAAREREQRRLQQERERQEEGRLAQTIRRGWLRDATGGSRRYFFETRTGRISYLDLTDLAVGRLNGGSAAIVETAGAVRGDYCVITDRAAEELRRLEPDRLVLFRRDRPEGGGPAR